MRVVSSMSMVVAAAMFAAGSAGCDGEKGKAAPVEQVKAAPAKQAVKGGPAIACDKPEFDFGKVSQGMVMNHVFTVKNVGDDVLNILSARGG